MNFTQLCDFFETIKKANHSEKFSIAKTNMKTFKEQAKHFTKFTKIEDNFFLILRLIVPKLDHERQAYRIKESKIARIIIKMLSLPNGNDKTILSTTCLQSNCDYGDVVYNIIRKYITNYKSDLTIEELDKYLDDIANRTSDNGLDDLLLELFRKSTPTNIKWIIQIILKNLNIGIGANKLLNSFHQDGATYYSMNTNLKRLCEYLWDSQRNLNELQVCLFESFKPMLSKRCDSQNFHKCFPASTKHFYIENKFDGERFQLHMEDGKFKYFSRNGYDYTNNYGATFTEGLITPKLKEVFADEVRKIILDGEMMLWNKTTQKFGSKGMTLDVKKLHEGKYQPCFCVFDILQYNEKILTNEPLTTRLKYLRKAITHPREGTIILSEYSEAHCQEDIIDALNLSVDNEEEGIIIKNLNSVYKFSDRNSGWFKLKMEYFDDVIHDLDLIIMGGCYGTVNHLTSFFVGISSGKNKDNQQTYLSFSRISSGLNDLELDELNERFKKFGKMSPVSDCMLFGSDHPDIYIEPSDTCVLTVRASELIRSTDNKMKTSFTLRFPRVLAVRKDKPVEDCFSMNELLVLSQQNKPVIKLNKRHIELTELTTISRPKKVAKIEIPTLNEFNVISDTLLKGLKFFVASGNEECPKDQIYTIIKYNGGKIAFREEPDIDIVLIGRIDNKTDDVIRKFNKTPDFILVSWLQRVLKSQSLVNYNSDEIVCCGRNIRINLLGNDRDTYGDSYLEDTTIDSLKNSFELIKRSGDYFNLNNSLIEFKRRKFDGFVAYFDKYDEVNNSNSKVIYNSLIDEIEFKYHGGIVKDEITFEINLIVIETDDRLDLLKGSLNNFRETSNGSWEVEIKTAKMLLYCDQ